MKNFKFLTAYNFIKKKKLYNNEPEFILKRDILYRITLLSYFQIYFL